METRILASMVWHQTKGVFIIYVRGAGKLELGREKLHTPPLRGTKITNPPPFSPTKVTTPPPRVHGHHTCQWRKKVTHPPPFC